VPSPELALQKSIDRVHDFLDSLNERVETPARLIITLPTTSLAPAGSAPPAQPVSYIVSRPTSSTAEAMPLYGRGGVAWFAFGDGYARVHCAPGDTCIIRLAPGEIVADGALNVQPGPGWRTDLVRGTGGIHSRWAIALTSTPSAVQTVLHLTTNRRTYAMLLDPSDPSMRTIAFTYSPEDSTIEPDPPADPASTAAAPDFAYQLTGPDVAWKPMRVYSDHGLTYIEFPAGGVAAAPRLVIIAPSKAAAEAYKTVGNSYVVEGIVDEAILIGRDPSAPVVRIVHVGREQ
jgi:type IV secretion system protein VirB9